MRQTDDEIRADGSLAGSVPVPDAVPTLAPARCEESEPVHRKEGDSLSQLSSDATAASVTHFQPAGCVSDASAVCQCGKAFRLVRKWQKYCSHKCRQAAWFARVREAAGHQAKTPPGSGQSPGRAERACLT
jgi:hypothetical protein